MSKMESSGIDFRDLRVLDALIREGSITRAAQSLETTQPAFSKLLTRLRARFDDSLPEPGHRARQACDTP